MQQSTLEHNQSQSVQPSPDHFSRYRDRYLSLVKHCILRTLFPDKNIDPEGNVLPFAPAARHDGRLYPTEAWTMVGRLRLEAVERACITVLEEGIQGDFVECGVWRGGCAIMMKAVLLDWMERRRVWLFDSFAGAPNPSMAEDAGDTHSQYHFIFAVPLETVQDNFRQLDLLDDDVVFRKGWFRDTIPAAADLDKIAVLRLDGDLYESTIQPLEHFYPRISRGGYVLVDDYHILPGCRRAIDDFRRSNGITAEMHTVDWYSIYWRVGRERSLSAAGSLAG